MDIIKFLASEKDLQLLKLIVAGIAALVCGIWVVFKFFASKPSVTARDKSIASGRDTNISIGTTRDDE